MMPRLFCCTLVLTATSFGAVASTYAQDSIKTAVAPERQLGAGAGEYRIGPADVLQISVWKSEALSRTVPVRPDGMISLPLVNDVRAAGLTPMQLHDVLKKKLAEFMPRPEVSVIVKEMHSFMVSVLGEVKTAGRYQFESPITVLDVLARAGGITEFASPSDLYVLRPEQNGMKRIPFNYRNVITAPNGNDNFFVRPGDIIVVP